MLHTMLARFVFLAMCISNVHGKSLTWKQPLKWLVQPDFKTASWSPWGFWSKCSEAVCCRHGVMSRRRDCMKPTCVGIEIEAEDCPKSNCKKCSSGPLADTTTAAHGSFINLECETMKKHSASGKFSPLVRHLIYKQFPALEEALSSGFFNMQKLFLPNGKMRRKLNVYKFCFEPKLLLTSREARRIFRFNRSVRVSYPRHNPGLRRVNGVVITVLPNGHIFKPGLYFTATDRNGVRAFYRYAHKRRAHQMV